MGESLRFSLSTGTLYAYPLRPVFRWARQAGFDGVELVINPEAAMRGGRAVQRLAQAPRSEAHIFSRISITALDTGDLDGDGDVDGTDIGIFSQDFGREDCGGGCPGDLDGDGDVDNADMGLFVLEFGRNDCSN